MAFIAGVGHPTGVSNTKAFDLDRIGGPNALSTLVEQVVQAGNEACALFEKGLSIEIKSDQSPVTTADRQVEKRLKNYLFAHHPEASFFGEETGKSKGAGTELRFILDPIDGTRAFIRGLPTWSVLLGMEFEGQPVVGIAYMPATKELFVGVIGHGATMNGKELHVSTTSTLKASMLMHGVLQQFTDAGVGDALIPLAEQSDSARGFADFEGYKNVLLGRADAMVDPGVQPYDICTPAVLIRAAGGRFTSLNGQETIYGPGAVASNGMVHDELIAITKRPILR